MSYPPKNKYTPTKIYNKLAPNSGYILIRVASATMFLN